MIPSDAEGRKNLPVVTGFLDYFPMAALAVAELSRVANDQHNPGQPMHWARGKSMDHADCLVRHLLQRGTVDTDGVRHTTKVAWRAMALLQEELEAEIEHGDNVVVNASGGVLRIGPSGAGNDRPDRHMEGEE